MYDFFDPESYPELETGEATTYDRPTEQAYDVYSSPKFITDGSGGYYISQRIRTIKWTSGNGDGRVVFVRASDSDVPVLVDDTVYTPDSNYGDGTEVDGWFCVYRGTASEVDVNFSLLSSFSYKVFVSEYYNYDGGDKFTLETNDTNPSSTLKSESDPIITSIHPGSPVPIVPSVTTLPDEYNINAYVFKIREKKWTKIDGILKPSNVISIISGDDGNYSAYVVDNYSDVGVFQYPSLYNIVTDSYLETKLFKIGKMVVQRIQFDYEEYSEETTNVKVYLKTYNEKFSVNPSIYEIASSDVRVWHRIPNQYGRCEAFSIIVINAYKLKEIIIDYYEIGA